jgi:hypothetical protein
MADSCKQTDCILLQWTMQSPSLAAAQAMARTAYSGAFADALGKALRQAAGLDTRLEVQRLAWSAGTGRIYAYAGLPGPAPVPRQALQALQAVAQALLEAPGLAACRLTLAFDRPGASHGLQRHAHYTVEMDPAEGWMPEIFRWYDEEHMPGLAAVPGNIHSRRYLNHDGGPLSLACYDLVDAEVLGCPAWLQVRATAWSDITRPHFTNTLRTMFSTMDREDTA